jgi:hypothetical protein
MTPSNVGVGEEEPYSHQEQDERIKSLVGRRSYDYLENGSSRSPNCGKMREIITSSLDDSIRYHAWDEFIQN